MSISYKTTMMVMPNSVGGVDVWGEVKNEGSKEIKYITLYFEPRNRVGDVVECTVSHKSEKGLKITGPIKPGKKEMVHGETVWYNNSIVSYHVVRAEVEYMDGSKETIPGDQIGKPKGCYVATAVYGSYDCPQVWTLRRYRDFELAKTWHGRLFVRLYYAVSPTLVKWFGRKAWFRKLWKNKLDRMVTRLNQEGVADTPYIDMDW